MQGNREDNNDKIFILKIIFYSISSIILICFAVALLVSIIKDSKKVDLQMEETELAVYYVEDIEDLHIGEECEIRKINAYGEVLCSSSFVQINMEEKAMQELERAERKTEEKERPSKEMVLYMRSAVTEGMSEEEIARITENIKVANHVMEAGYLYDSLFERLEDSEDLYWNYVDQKGEIQIGWALSDTHYDADSGMTLKEYEEKYGTPVKTDNRFDADNFMDLMIEMRDSFKSELLKEDFDNLIHYMQLAKDTHDVEYMIKIYRILHDMDYFLFRYGIEDVGKYVKDTSTISKYYGVLNVYE